MGNGKLLGTNQFTEFVVAIVRSLPRDINSEVAQGWIQNQKALKKVLTECLCPASTGRKSLQELISAGNFGYVNPDITEANFPDVGIDMQEAKMYEFKKGFSSDYVLKEMEKDGYRPANLRELLTWMPNWSGKDWVVALGQAWRDPDGDRYVPCLHYWHGRRELHLGWIGSDWPSYYRFLAFRKS